MERFTDPDELSFELEVDGEQVRRQLARQLWIRGAWATGAYHFQDRDADGAWRAPKVALVRLRKVAGAWRKHAAITLPSTVVTELAGLLAAWHDPAATDDASADTDDA